LYLNSILDDIFYEKPLITNHRVVSFYENFKIVYGEIYRLDELFQRK